MAYLIGLKNRPPIPKSEGQKQSESADYNRQSVDPWSFDNDITVCIARFYYKTINDRVILTKEQHFKAVSNCKHSL